MLDGREIIDASPVVRRVRNVKSEQEIAKIHYVCDLTSAAFDALPGSLAIGDSERACCRRLRIDLLERGADGSPYLIGASGPGGMGQLGGG